MGTKETGTGATVKLNIVSLQKLAKLLIVSSRMSKVDYQNKVLQDASIIFLLHKS